MQARLALEHGRHVFLLESLLELDWAQDHARRPGATVVRDVDDLELWVRDSEHKSHVFKPQA
jgi:DNA processing protein